MAGLKSTAVILFIMVVASFQLQSTVAQSTRHVVGDAMGWAVPSAGAAAYTTWASGKTFTVGDTLFFNFTTGAHNVEEVSQAAYGPCTTANPISQTATGPATLTLRTAGNHYYICGVGPHCSLGQKFTINVAAPSSSTPPAATSPAPAGSTPSSQPPPPAPSSAPSSFTAVIPVTFLAAALAFF